MTVLIDIASIVLPIFLVIGLGYLLGGIGFVDGTINSFLSRLVFYLAAPALLFRSAARSPLGETVDAGGLAVTAGVTFLFALAVYSASFRVPPSRRGVLAQGAHRSNMVFMGLPVIINAFGDRALGPAAVLIGFMVVVYNFLAVLVLVLPHRGNGSEGKGVWIETTIKIAKNPLIIASGAGIAFSALGIGLPLWTDRTLDLVGRIAMPLALLSVGANLDFGRLRSEIGPASIVCGLKLAVYPALVWAGLSLAGRSGLALEVPVLIMASPAAVVSYIMAREMEGDEGLAAAVVIGTTIASLVTISGWLAFFSFLH